MLLTQLGTGAAERIPALFCACDVCLNAREKGGREVRTQTQALVNDDLLIDFGSDSYMHFLTQNLPFDRIEDLLVTHWHADHLIAEEVALRMTGYGNDLPGVLTVYGSGEVNGFTIVPSSWKGVKIPAASSSKKSPLGTLFLSPKASTWFTLFTPATPKTRGTPSSMG